jgi:hypothetical protein
MNHQKKEYIKYKLERCNDIELQTEAYQIIMAHHPDKKIRMSEETILMFFHNLTIDCYDDLMQVVHKMPRITNLNKLSLEPTQLNQTLLGAFKARNHALIKNLSQKEARILFSRHMQEKINA